MKNFEIVKIKKNHSKELTSIQIENSKEIGNNIWNEKEINSHIDNNFFFGRVFLYENLIKGFLFGREVDDFFELISIFIIPSLRNKGIGGRMLENCKEFCKSRMLKEIIIEVSENNLIAKEFYLKKNFYAFGKRKNYYEVSGEKINACLMKLKI